MLKLYKNDLKGNKNLLGVSGRFQLLRFQVTKGKITVHVWRKFGRNQLNFGFELAWGSSLRGFVLCHNLLKESMLSNATKKNVGFVEAKKYIKLTKEPNLHGQTLE